MAHVLIVGTVESGKSTLARALCSSYTAGRIVLDPLAHPEWHADRVYTDGPRFLATAMQARQCALFVDEAPHVIGRFDSEMHWLATQSRHRGHWAHFVSQRPQQLPPVVREQCPILFCFRVSPPAAALLAYEYTQPQIEAEAPQLGQGEFLRVRRWGGCERLRLFQPGGVDR